MTRDDSPRPPRAARAALTGGVVGNYVDQLHIFLPLTALAPALPHLVGADAIAGAATLTIVATLLGRPFGAVVFGRLADRFGRTAITQLAIAGTAACTLAIACLPTHETIGIAAIGLVLLLRFLGGMFLAGEYTSAIPLAMEWSQPRRRGLFSGLIMAMAPWAQATIALATLGLLAVLGPEAYAVYGWRLAFAAGGVASLLVLAYYHRNIADAKASQLLPADSAVPEAEETQAAGPGDRPAELGSLRAVVLGRWARPFWAVFLLMTGLWLMTNMVVIRMAAYLGEGGGAAHLTAETVPVVMAAAAIAQALVMSVTGHISTLVGRRRFFVLAGIIAAIGGPVLYVLITQASTVAGITALVCLIQALTVTAYGPIGAHLSEIFPAEVRSTGYGTAYSASIVVPALFPFWLPALALLLGGQAVAVVAVLALGGIFVALGGVLSTRSQAAAEAQLTGS
ncbi:MFS transporter [Brevibacterium otitidis]|uniref:MFS transporter n=1 Tax=Brevibacterium otitidis TaxID=53364 RepID=A0ABV5X0Q4_9MICO|nr:MFS transporter [Brevibacterium otitidis]